MKTHELKCWTEPFAAILDGSKRHEVRKNDRGYAVGDVLHLREWDPPVVGGRRATEDERYTGRSVNVRVTHVTEGGSWGLPRFLCVMSIEPATAESRLADVQGGEAATIEAIALWLETRGLFPGDTSRAIAPVYNRAWNNARCDAARQLRNGNWRKS